MWIESFEMAPVTFDNTDGGPVGLLFPDHDADHPFVPHPVVIPDDPGVIGPLFAAMTAGPNPVVATLTKEVTGRFNRIVNVCPLTLKGEDIEDEVRIRLGNVPADGIPLGGDTRYLGEFLIAVSGLDGRNAMFGGDPTILRR